MEKATLNFPAVELKKDRNGKIHAPAELWYTVIAENTPDTLKTYTVKEFAVCVIKHYGVTTSDPNGATSFLRGMVNGSRLEFEFEFSDAKPASKLAIMRKQLNAMHEALLKAGLTEEAITALLNN